MDPQHIFCSNSDCPARGQTGKGNVRIHSRKERRYQCTECGQTFAARTGTAFHRLRTAEETVTLVISLLAYGCPVQAIVVAFGFDERTVKKWQTRAGSQCKQVHAHLVEQPRDLGQVQADELWVKLQGLKAWMAMALQVSTRLWLGGVISQHRDMALIVTLVQKIRACALPRPLLVCVWTVWPAMSALSGACSVTRCPPAGAVVRGCARGVGYTSPRWSSSMPAAGWWRSASASSRDAARPLNGCWPVRRQAARLTPLTSSA